MTKYNDNNIKVYVYERSIEIDNDLQASIRRSIENERTKAGVIFGFFFLFLIELLQYFELLPDFFKGVSFVIIFMIFYYLYNGFCSVKMNDGIDTDGNFSADWSDSTREKFLKKQHTIIRDNVQTQKLKLTKISDYIKKSIILIIVLVAIIFINSNIDMFKILGGDDESQNTMQSETHEMAEPPADNSNDGNTMKPENFEKGAK